MGKNSPAPAARQQHHHGLRLELHLGENALDTSLIAGIGSRLGETLSHFLALDTASFYGCLHRVDDELLAAQMVNKPRLVENFFNFVSKYFELLSRRKITSV